MCERYLARRRARFRGICGQVNLPYGTVLEARDGFLLWEGRRLCTVTSENAHQYFVPDGDGQGVERGELISAILARLERRDKEHQARWDALWADPLACHYRRLEHGNHWLWRQEFYRAPVADLRHIAGLIGAKVT